ncbi:unnamed protein product [Didymodactylos carnosus]|uniref:Uncharacterized protein n=1 Tax=Didymodactylos carnosus TaxID=1234261 RepID=A0A814BAU7_9BILA|nr:unnamed protein product [Didymodactylos carnosus]CAF0925550.1 unnamed protein product [Didymodactylos carnosus]CAF3518685.1 unnamed protein product [Didymodactylos carnosus]CAF3704232.1 unnamed protein product [Didymodactylos carnosus]
MSIDNETYGTNNRKLLIILKPDDNNLITADYKRYKQLKTFKYQDARYLTRTTIKQQQQFVFILNYYPSITRKLPKQKCMHYIQRVFYYLLTLLLLSNNIQWPIVFLSLSSIKFMSTYAIVTTTTTTTLKRTTTINDQCLPLDNRNIQSLCSRTCTTSTSPLSYLLQEDNDVEDNTKMLLSNYYLPFCKNYTLIQMLDEKESISILNTSKSNEKQCKSIIEKIIKLDNEAKEATDTFNSYMKAIDCDSNDNRFSINADCDNCKQAYEQWACSISIPFFYRGNRILPCQKICDEVERVCPTFRPSDREPLFAGQPIFVCSGGLIPNNDYGQIPYCYDTCHLVGSQKSHSSSQSSSSSSSNDSTSSTSSLSTSSTCFEIKLTDQQLTNITATTQSQFYSLLNNETNIFSNYSSSASSYRLINNIHNTLLYFVITIMLLLSIISK